MRYLFFSDIHGSLPALRQTLDFYDNMRCDLMCVLGDLLNYGPRNRLPEGLDAKGVAELLNQRADDIIAVRGNCDSEVDQMLLNFPIMSTYTMLVDEGRRMLLTHGHVYDDTRLPAGKFDAVVCGHTHLWHLEKENGMIKCNTGSVTFPKNGNFPTLCIYENGAFSMYKLDGTLLKTLSF